MPTTVEREVSRLFSAATFRPLLAGTSSDRADAATTQLRIKLNLAKNIANRDVVQAAYDILSRNYRNEYFYRNLITSKIFVGRHRASNSILLNEFRIGDAVADCVMINGSGTVYEIKTEFDSPEKLPSQLQNYYRAFSLVNVVTHASQRDKYLRALKDTPAGLLIVGLRHHLTEVKAAKSVTDGLYIRTMFNTLRAQEVEAILRRRFSHIPEVPNALRYSAFLELAKQISPIDFQREMQRELKNRNMQKSRQLILRPTSFPLRAVLSQLDPDVTQQRHLSKWLDSKDG